MILINPDISLHNTHISLLCHSLTQHNKQSSIPAI